MYLSKISGRGPKHCSGSKFQCRPRPVYLQLKLSLHCWIVEERATLESHLPIYCLHCNFVYFSTLGNQIRWAKLVGQNIILDIHVELTLGKIVIDLDCMDSKTKAKLDPQANFPRWQPPDLHADGGRGAHRRICQFLIAETCSIFLNQVY